jgi:hypothetical protein
VNREILLREACFQQACEETRLLLADTSIHSSEYAFVSEFHESLHRRGRSLTNRPGQAVNFHAIVRKSLPEHFADFSFDAKQLRFSKRLLPAILFWFSYKKDHSAMGKMFGIDLGVSMDKTVEFSASIFRFFGTDFDVPTWVYHTQEELRLCLAESLQMLSKVLPAFQNSLGAYMSLDGSSRPKWMQVERAASARHALEECFELAGVTEAEMALQWIVSWPRIRDRNTAPSPWTKSGILEPEGFWKISAFKKDDPHRTLMIEYPYEGPIRFGWRKTIGWSPAIERWMDSPEAVDRMRSFAQTDEEPRGLKLGGHAPATWSGSLGQSWHLAINASSGEKIEVP